ncbi:RDD family protein [Loktanella sp. R86503]|uniref:RDD family protein n=1 Tax=Loktanella sp. R86503 TaxID=3093847 RepID=UPI0036DF0E91
MTDFADTLTALPDPDDGAEFYARVPFKRALAWVVDASLVLVASVIIVPFTAFTALFYFPFLILMVGFAYRWFTIAGRSATWGMRLMGIELRDHTGARLDGTRALLHTLGYAVSVTAMPLQFISMGMMALTPCGRGLTDTLMGTAMINRPG